MVTAILSVVINWFLTVFVMTVIAFFVSAVKDISPQTINMIPAFAAIVVAAWVGVGAFTPVGEWIIKKAEKCTDRPSAELRRLQYLFTEVCSRAGIDPAQYKLFISQSEQPNAFATGKKTVAATAGIMQIESDEQIKGVLAHELGHHQLGHTFWGKITYFSSVVGNMALRIYNVFNAFLAALCRIPVIGLLIVLIMYVFLAMFFVMKFLILIPHNLGYLFGSRRDEYAADQFAARLGYGPSLAEFLQTEVIPKEGAPGGFLAALHSTHPQTWKRVDRLRNS